MRKYRIFLILAGFVFLNSCDIYKQDPYQDIYVVEAYLIANSPLPFIRLSTTSPLHEKYKLSKEYISDADVEVRLLKADSTIEDVFRYYGSGTYFPLDSIIVRENRLYQLHITLTNGDVVKALTRVPADFETVNELDDSYVYQSEQQIKVTITPSQYPGRQSFYIFTVNTMEADSSNLTPFYKEMVVEKGNYMKTYFINSSGIITEESLKQSSNGNLTFPLPWLSIAFYGKNKVIVNAIDDNMYDFLKSQNKQMNGIGFTTGEIHNVNYNIKGGIGIFGSMASDTNIVFIKRPDG